jgi:hypothetical protein
MTNMRKKITCPDCGAEFNSPYMDWKNDHLGLTIPGLGIVRCPECKVEHRRSEFLPVEGN